MLRALLQALKDEPDGARLISGLTIPVFVNTFTATTWRFASAPATSLALDGALLAQVRAP